jgi:hypothetical protein
MRTTHSPRSHARHVRFARALALLGAAAAGCRGGGDDDALAAISDATTDVADANARDGGKCRVLVLDAPTDLECPAEGACSYPDDATLPRCTFGVDAAGDGYNEECGSITCAEYCYCAGPAAGVCGCLHGISGPLPPPELPRRSASRARRRMRLV